MAAGFGFPGPDFSRTASICMHTSCFAALCVRAHIHAPPTLLPVGLPYLVKVCPAGCKSVQGQLRKGSYTGAHHWCCQYAWAQRQLNPDLKV